MITSTSSSLNRLEDPHALGAALDLVDCGVAVLGPDQQVMQWNQWLRRYSGIDETQALGKTLTALFGIRVSPRLIGVIDECLKRGRSQVLSSSLNRAPLPLFSPNPRESANEGNEPILQAVAVKPLLLDDGRRCCLIQVTDVSAMERRERFLRRQAEDLAHAMVDLQLARDLANQANLAKTEFLTNLSHELRTPLNSVIGFSQLLLMEDQDSLRKEQREFIDYIQRSGEHLLNMITDILDISKIEIGKLSLSVQNLDVGRMVQEALVAVRLQAVERSITLDHDPIESGATWVKADHIRLLQILINLLTNAIKYNRVGGRVRISVAPISEERIRFTIEDTGFGIPKERQGELFQSFNRLGAENSAIEGSGLGLTLSRHLAERMNGQIGFKSASGVGSTFWVELPAVSIERERETGIESQLFSGALEQSLETERPILHTAAFSALYIEDNPQSRRLMNGVFANLPRAVLVVADDGPQGIELAKAMLPTVILLDIHLPGLDGFEVLDQLRNSPETAGIPVVAITASALDEDVQRGLAVGFVEWLVKPLDIPRLLAVLARLLRRRGETRPTTIAPMSLD
ncbi:hypothetical protein WCLP8_4730008 [uncultured Gammaproteobacteria bacterium]